MAYTDKEKQREYQREWARKRRESFFSDKWCVKCGSTDALQLDHIDPKTKRYSPSALWSMSENNPNRIAELKKCQVLCNPCHRKKTNGIGGDLHNLNLSTSKTMVCSYGHDMNVVGYTRHTKPNGFIKKCCSYCAHLYNAGRRNGKTKTLEEFVLWRRSQGALPL